MSDPAPVVFLGFDAAALPLVQEGVGQGWLPAIAGLLDRGRCAVLTSSQPEFPGAAWPTTNTGTSVYEHGVFLDRALRSGSYEIVHVRSSHARRPPFWRYVSDAGLRSTIGGVYSAPLLRSFRGVQIVEWGTADPYAKLDGRTVDPPELLGRLERAVGRRNLAYHLSEPVPDTHEGVRRYRDRRLLGVEQQTRSLRLLLDETKWSFFFGSFSEAHPAGHLLWHLGDPAHPDHEPGAPADIREALRSIYRAIDAGLGELVARCQEGAYVFVLTPHGMAPNHAIGQPLPEVLERGGWLVRRAARSGGAPTLTRRAFRRARRTVPSRFQPALARLVTRVWDPDGLPVSLGEIDWSKTQAFPLPQDLVSNLRINLEGREPAGIVRPGREYDEVLTSITVALEELVHASSGQPAVERVVRTDSVLGRPPPDGFPDLCVLWASDGRLRTLSSAALGTIEVDRRDSRTGHHPQTGFVIGAGPGIEPSGAPVLDGPAQSLLDVAPTALSLLGVPLPSALPGRPISVFSAGRAATTPEGADRVEPPVPGAS